MIRVMHIITRMDRGGSAQNTLASCIGLADKYQISLVHGLSLESGMTREEEASVTADIQKAADLGVEVEVVPNLVRAIHPKKDTRALFELVRVIKKHRPHIVHTHCSKAGALGRLAAFLARSPVVIHTPHGHVFFGHFSGPASILYLWSERFLRAFTHWLVALTEGEKRDYLKLGVVSPKRIETIPSGVCLDTFGASPISHEQARKNLEIGPDKPVIGFVGWLLPIKGPEILLQAMETVWEKHPQAHLVLVGKGDMQEELEQNARNLGRENQVKFLGWRKDVQDIMPAFDVFALPSRNEGMGRVLVEAMAAGIPLVASRVGGIPDLVRHGKNGLLVSPGEPAEMGRALVSLLDDPQAARAMGRHGQRHCENFSDRAMLEGLDALYQKALTQKELYK